MSKKITKSVVIVILTVLLCFCLFEIIKSIRYMNSLFSSEVQHLQNSYMVAGKLLKENSNMTEAEKQEIIINLGKETLPATEIFHSKINVPLLYNKFCKPRLNHLSFSWAFYLTTHETMSKDEIDKAEELILYISNKLHEKDLFGENKKLHSGADYIYNFGTDTKKFAEVLEDINNRCDEYLRKN